MNKPVSQMAASLPSRPEMTNTPTDQSSEECTCYYTPHSPTGTVRERRMDNLLIWTHSFSPSVSLSPVVHRLVPVPVCGMRVCARVAKGREKRRINDCNKWRWTFQGLCSLPVFFSILLLPTAKYVLISMHIYNLHWTSESPVFSEVIGPLCGAESTISNTHRLSSPSFKLWWYKAHICICALHRHVVSWVW